MYKKTESKTKKKRWVHTLKYTLSWNEETWMRFHLRSFQPLMSACLTHYLYTIVLLIALKLK